MEFTEFVSKVGEPAGATDRVEAEKPAQPIPIDEFVDRVADELSVDADEARSRIRAVFATLREAVTRGELEDVLGQLEPEYADLLA